MVSILLVLVRGRRAAPPPPEAFPAGRAALALRGMDIPVVFGDDVRGGHAWGLRPEPGGWAPVRGAPIAAVHDRYPGGEHPQQWRRLLAEAGDAPVLNAPALSELCRDKLACQRLLEQACPGLSIPAIEGDPERFQERLAQWGTAFWKPRRGALGRGVRRVTGHGELGTAAPGRAPHGARASDGPPLLQAAVAPPTGYAGLALRVLVQRSAADGGLVVAPIVARCSADDPVANVARGAAARLAELLLPAESLAAAADDARTAFAALTARSPGVELGFDFAIDAELRPWLIEVNHCPKGRLEALAEADPARFATAHAQACRRPLEATWAAHLAARG